MTWSKKTGLLFVDRRHPVVDHRPSQCLAFFLSSCAITYWKRRFIYTYRQGFDFGLKSSIETTSLGLPQNYWQISYLSNGKTPLACRRAFLLVWHRATSSSFSDGNVCTVTIPSPTSASGILKITPTDILKNDKNAGVRNHQLTPLRLENKIIAWIVIPHWENFCVSLSWFNNWFKSCVFDYPRNSPALAPQRILPPHGN